MKIDRLLGILAVLSQEHPQKITAPYLAKKFEVSRRTISRDIDVLCQAGVPIVTEQGRNGGISIAPGYKLNSQVLTEEEMQAISSGLRGLDSVSRSAQNAALREKLEAAGGSVRRGPAPGELLIDLASHYKDSLTEKIALLRKAIREHKLVSFRYYSEKGESLRTVEPYVAAFQWGDWYLLAWCVKRRDFRLFKLSRLWELSLTGQSFSPRPIPPEQLDFQRVWQENYRLEALFDPRVKYRLVEEYGPACFTVREDGLLYLSLDFTFYSAMLSWALSFGDAVQVLAPKELQDDLRRQGEIFLERYGKQDK